MIWNLKLSNRPLSFETYLKKKRTNKTEFINERKHFFHLFCPCLLHFVHVVECMPVNRFIAWWRVLTHGLRVEGTFTSRTLTYQSTILIINCNGNANNCNNKKYKNLSTNWLKNSHCWINYKCSGRMYKYCKHPIDS